MLQWVTGQHGALLHQFDSAAPDVHNNLLARTAFAVILAEHPQHETQATTLIADVAAQAYETRSPLSLGAAAILASVSPDQRSTETTETLRQIIEPFRGSAIVPGAALSHLGPASLSLARLMTDGAAREELLRQAVAEADQWNLRLWSVISLRDLAVATNDESFAEAARIRAAGSQLEMLL